jgi:hypothetical protein
MRQARTPRAAGIGDLDKRRRRNRLQARMTTRTSLLADGSFYTPPLTGITCPVIPVFAVEDRYTIGGTASSASSSRLIGASEL